MTLDIIHAPVTRLVLALVLARFVRPRHIVLDVGDDPTVRTLFRFLPHRTPRRLDYLANAEPEASWQRRVDRPDGPYDVVLDLEVGRRARVDAALLAPGGVALVIDAPVAEARIATRAGKTLVVRDRIGLVAPEGQELVRVLPPPDARVVRALGRVFDDADLAAQLVVPAFPESSALALYALGRPGEATPVATPTREASASTRKTPAPTRARHPAEPRRATSRDYIVERLTKDGLLPPTRPSKEWADRVAAEVVEMFSTPERPRTTKATDVLFVWGKLRG